MSEVLGRTPYRAADEGLLKPVTTRTRMPSVAWLLVLPATVHVAVFALIPVLVLVYLSFFQFSPLAPPIWVGLQNYSDLLTGNEFSNAFRNTAIYAGGYTAINLVIAIAIALMLNQRVAGAGAFRGIYFLPMAMSGTSFALIGLWILDTRFGLLNYLFSVLNLPPQSWLLQSSEALKAIIGVSVWQSVGYNVVVFLAGLQAIPAELHEAAALDGARGWSKFRLITLPLIRPVTFYALLTTTIFAFQVFAPILVLTGGGPGRDTTTSIVLAIYRNAFLGLRFGAASAMAIVLLAIILTLTLVNFRIFSPRDR
jgi:multiple sugar transport system permease protein